MTIRRSLVFAVCTVGVACLYLAPGTAPAPAPSERGSNLPSDEPTARPGGRTTPSTPPISAKTSDTGSGTSKSSAPRSDPADPSPERPTGGERRSTGTGQPAGRGTGPGATPYGPDDRRDREPPQSVREITTAPVTADRLGLSWAPARDNVGVVGYHVWLNGFEVASTAETRVSVAWFNEDSSTNVVQVRAVDAAGNESESSPSVLVTRPDPEPSPTPSTTTEPTEAPTEPKPTATEQPTSEAEPEAEAEAEASSLPTGEPSGSEE